MRHIGIVDETYRDAPQCLWASRISTAMMLPVAERMDRIGFEEIALTSPGANADVAVRHLKENPWERVKLLRQRITRTPLVYSLRAKNDIGFHIVPLDISLLWIERFIANGLQRFRTVDPLQDMDNIVPLLNYAKDNGNYTIGMLAYGHSPVHTDALYASKARELVARTNLDAVMIKDPGGLLTPDRIRTLVPAIRAEIGSRPLELHSHCTTGLAPLVYHEGIKAGVDHVHTSIAPLANGAAQPAMQTMVRNLRETGYQVSTDDALVEEVSDFYRRVAAQEGKPVGKPVEYDAFHYEHQVPGGMISNFRSQLAEAGLSHKLDQLLHECARIRQELGWPIMITPFAQFVGTQAVINVVTGDRYGSVPDGMKEYALGYYGKLLAPVEPNVLDRIIDRGSRNLSLVPVPPEPAVPELRRKYPHASDEERLLRYSYAGSQVDDMIAAGPAKTDYIFHPSVSALLDEISRRPRTARVFIQRHDLLIDLRS
jgi:oxaloacetate decarboxylase alpha subunit